VFVLSFSQNLLEANPAVFKKRPDVCPSKSVRDGHYLEVGRDGANKGKVNDFYAGERGGHINLSTHTWGALLYKEG